jgi:hypothetical protein
LLLQFMGSYYRDEKICQCVFCALLCCHQHHLSNIDILYERIEIFFKAFAVILNRFWNTVWTFFSNWRITIVYILALKPIHILTPSKNSVPLYCTNCTMQMNTLLQTANRRFSTEPFCTISGTFFAFLNFIHTLDIA